MRGVGLGDVGTHWMWRKTGCATRKSVCCGVGQANYASERRDNAVWPLFRRSDLPTGISEVAGMRSARCRGTGQLPSSHASSPSRYPAAHVLTRNIHRSLINLIVLLLIIFNYCTRCIRK